MDTLSRIVLSLVGLAVLIQISSAGPMEQLEQATENGDNSAQALLAAQAEIAKLKAVAEKDQSLIKSLQGELATKQSGEATKEAQDIANLPTGKPHGRTIPANLAFARTPTSSADTKAEIKKKDKIIMEKRNKPKSSDNDRFDIKGLNAGMLAMGSPETIQKYLESQNKGKKFRVHVGSSSP